MPPPTPPPILTSTTTIFTRATLTLATTQRLINTWLPPTHPSLSTTTTTTTKEEEKEQDEIFTAEPEVLGVGATVLEDGDVVKREGLSSNETLRRQLLGRDYKKVRAGKGDKGALGGVAVVGSKPRPPGSTREIGQESGDEEGRSSLGKSKRKRRVGETEEGAGVSDEEVTRISKAGMETSRPQKRAVNYLDQVLAERSRRQRKKSKKRKKHDSES